MDEKEVIERLLKQIKEEKRGREEAERQQEQEKRGREEAEKRVEEAKDKTRSTGVFEYMQAMHKDVFMALKVQKNKHWTTQGKPIHPDNKICPTRLKSWESFPEEQMDICERLLSITQLSSKESRTYKCTTTIKDWGGTLGRKPLGSEQDLNIFDHFAIIEPVVDIFNKLFALPEAKAAFGLAGTIEFENHPNPLAPASEDVQQRVKQFSTLKADAICIYARQDNNPRTPMFVIERKPPHKLTLPHLRVGLREMNVPDEVVNRLTKPHKDAVDEVFQYTAERFTAGTITQAYDYMMVNGLEYSYVSTGEAMVFLRIAPNEPETVYYHLADPRAEITQAQGRGDLYYAETRSAIFQVLSFCLMACNSSPHGLDWIKKHTEGPSRCRWQVNDFNLLKALPLTPENQKTPESAYCPRRYRALPLRSQYQTRLMRAANPEEVDKLSEETKKMNLKSRATCDPGLDSGYESPPNSGDDKDAASPTPAPKGYITSSTRNASSNAGKKSRNASKSEAQEPVYCTQKCLLGLRSRGQLDTRCPNYKQHQCGSETTQHLLDHSSFCRLLFEQLSRTAEQGLRSLHLTGSRGAMFQLTLTSHGYTVVGKGTIEVFVRDLENEASIYEHLEYLQGRIIPVYLGSFHLPFHIPYDFQVSIVYMMLLSWGGTMLHDNKALRVEKEEYLRRSLKMIRLSGVTHGDVRDANLLWNEEVQKVMVIDFERGRIEQEHWAKIQELNWLDLPSNLSSAWERVRSSPTYLSLGDVDLSSHLSSVWEPIRSLSYPVMVA